jgi:hypothetical protein
VTSQQWADFLNEKVGVGGDARMNAVFGGRVYYPSGFYSDSLPKHEKYGISGATIYSAGLDALNAILAAQGQPELTCSWHETVKPFDFRVKA